MNNRSLNDKQCLNLVSQYNLQHNRKVGSKMEMENMSLILLLTVQTSLVCVWNTDMCLCIHVHVHFSTN